MNKTKKIGITMGDYNGIGPEIVIKALNNLNLPSHNVVLFGNQKVLDFLKTKHYLKLKTEYEIISTDFNANDYNPGNETAYSGEFSYSCLKSACDFAKHNEISAIVTAPVSKNALHLAGHNFSGQTEVIESFLAHDGQKAEMLFTAKDFRVLLLTRHIPLSKVRITESLIIEKVKRLNESMIKNFGILEPSFALCSLNPHAGENGILGKDEQEEFAPAVRKLCESGIKITSPKPADTLFAKAAADYRFGIQSYDCYIACYHDQGLIPIKVLAMDECVNTTIGLDVLRTSPAHGTAYDIAPYCCARAESMQAAIEAAL